ncbi:MULTISPECIES: hypothetical protein [unclassified Micromonospora]|uniref:hypothetical protein n=1 Tax=unclassified Micromonospora TaxID=2617518 RepID=UPI0033AE3273
MLTAGPILATGEPPINFRAHEVRTGNSAGARDDFEQMLAMLVRATHPGARLIAANPGDWAIDVLVGDLAGAVVIWQAKYFMPLVTESHQAQIRESFTSALKAAQEHGHQVRHLQRLIARRNAYLAATLALPYDESRRKFIGGGGA